MQTQLTKTRGTGSGQTQIIPYQGRSVQIAAPYETHANLFALPTGTA